MKQASGLDNQYIKCSQFIPSNKNINQIQQGNILNDADSQRIHKQDIEALKKDKVVLGANNKAHLEYANMHAHHQNLQQNLKAHLRSSSASHNTQLVNIEHGQLRSVKSQSSLSQSIIDKSNLSSVLVNKPELKQKFYEEQQIIKPHKPQLQQQAQEFSSISSQLNVNAQVFNTQNKINIVNQSIIKQLESGGEKDKSLAKILTYIHEGSQKISVDDEQLVLVMGNTGAGKTSLTAYLSGADLVIKHTKYEEPYVDYMKKEEWHGKIGTSDTDSETFIPNKFVSNNGVVFWDCPGFADSKGAEVDIANSFYISRIAQNAKQIKFALVIDGSSFHNKGFGDLRAEAYKLLFETINQMSKGTNIDFSKNLTLIFTKTEKNPGFYKAKLDDLFDALQKSKSFNEKISKFFAQNCFSKFFDAIKKANVVTFPLPNGNPETLIDPRYREVLLDAISRTAYHDNTINMPASIRSLEKIQDLWEYTREKLSDTFDDICKELASHMQSLDRTTLERVDILITQFNKKYEVNPPLNNAEYLKNIEEDFITPYVEMLKVGKSSSIQDSVNLMKFLLTEVYDGLLSNIHLSEEVSEFFGKVGYYELGKGIISFGKMSEIAYSEALHKEKALQKEFVIQQQNSQISEKIVEIEQKTSQISQQQQVINDQTSKIKEKDTALNTQSTQHQQALKKKDEEKDAALNTQSTQHQQALKKKDEEKDAALNQKDTQISKLQTQVANAGKKSGSGSTSSSSNSYTGSSSSYTPSYSRSYTNPTTSSSSSSYTQSSSVSTTSYKPTTNWSHVENNRTNLGNQQKANVTSAIKQTTQSSASSGSNLVDNKPFYKNESTYVGGAVGAGGGALVAFALSSNPVGWAIGGALAFGALANKLFK